MSVILMVAASAAALLHSTMATSGPLIPKDAPLGPMPQNGVWALLPADCETPTSLDLAAWPKCATPIGFIDDEVDALERPDPGAEATPDQFNAIGRTRYAIASPAAPDAPAVAQVVVPAVLSRSYYYLAIAPSGPLDADGRFAAAEGWPIACRPKRQGGCRPTALADVQAQAAVPPSDPKRLYRMVRMTAEGPANLLPTIQTSPSAAPTTETPSPPASPAPIPASPPS